jgi:hypothetical protein
MEAGAAQRLPIDADPLEGTGMTPAITSLKSGAPQAAKTAVVKKRRKRMPIEKLALGLYVAEPDGIWTPIGTVSEKRISEYRVRRKPRKP